MKSWRDYIGHLVFGGSTGIGAVLAYKLVDSNPTLVLETFKSWGPLSLLCVMGMVMVDRGFRSMVGAAEKSATSQQILADAVRQIADRDNYRAQQQEILLGHIGTTMEKVLVKLEGVEQNTKARGVSA